MRSSFTRLVAWTAGLVVAHVALVSIISAMERPSSLGDVAAWLSRAQPVDVIVLTVSALVLVTVWYLLAATLLTVIASAVRWRPLHVVSHTLTIPALRRALIGVAGSTLVAAAAGPATAHAASIAPPVLIHLGPVDAPVTTTTSTTLPAPSPSAAPETPTMSTRTVAPGENLWVIAETHLTEELGRGPDETELLHYWGRLKDANRELSNPDVVRPGQVLRLPK